MQQKMRSMADESRDHEDACGSHSSLHVGLMTGDVTIAEEASCLVMTTEILRLMLYQGSTVMREVRWVIFDEVHVLGSADRGWVIEEALILLPHSVRCLLLSATLPNSLEIAQWLADLHGSPCHLLLTAHRPVPLRHYVFAARGEGLFLVQDGSLYFILYTLYFIL